MNNFRLKQQEMWKMLIKPKLIKCTLYPTQPGGYMYVSSPAYSSGVVGRIFEQLTLGIHLCAILASGPEFVWELGCYILPAECLQERRQVGGAESGLPLASATAGSNSPPQGGSGYVSSHIMMFLLLCWRVSWIWEWNTSCEECTERSRLQGVNVQV